MHDINFLTSEKEIIWR